MRLFKRKPVSEIHLYMQDLEIANKLRNNLVDKPATDEERVRYNTMIKVMQEIVIRLGGKVR